MSVMSIRIDEKKRKQLKTIASIQGKSMSSIVEDLIVEYVDNYVDSNKKSDEISMIMKASENPFEEWSNEEDEAYDDL